MDLLVCACRIEIRHVIEKIIAGPDTSGCKMIADKDATEKLGTKGMRLVTRVLAGLEVDSSPKRYSETGELSTESKFIGGFVVPDDA